MHLAAVEVDRDAVDGDQAAEVARQALVHCKSSGITPKPDPKIRPSCPNNMEFTIA